MRRSTNRSSRNSPAANARDLAQIKEARILPGYHAGTGTAIVGIRIADMPELNMSARDARLLAQTLVTAADSADALVKEILDRQSEEK